MRAVAILEGTCDIKVITVVSDGASPNQKFYRLHHQLQLDQDPDCDTMYRTSDLVFPERIICSASHENCS